MALRYPTQSETGRWRRHGAIPPAMRHTNLARGLSHRSQEVIPEGSRGRPEGTGRRAHRATGALRCGEVSIPGVDPEIVPRVAALRTGAMRLLPALRQAGTRPADHKEHPVCRWCHRSLTEETGPPPPPPEPLPDVSTATPCRPASGGLMSSCPIFVRARSSVHNMEVHARRAQPGVPIVEEVLARGCCNGSTVFLTGALRTRHYRKCQAYQRGKKDRAPLQAPMTTIALPPPLHHRRHGLLIPRRNTGYFASSIVGMPSLLRVRTATVWECPACTTARMRRNACHFCTDSPCVTHSLF
ncbi:hypothetical protein TCDM_13492 [Trypanosoma cruzi Dm28c]|uniref:Uncharacterized protein n=1 Tax=Trypanosoma cruzi Dm28c TaxID=1416333 RepID=V5AIK9_TRYCR|nr:hypothetical protein TCDM_13492 [Trypanosoma cruzi Dm28c]